MPKSGSTKKSKDEPEGTMSKGMKKKKKGKKM